MPAKDVAARSKPRGRDEVKSRLIEATSELLAEVGPRQLSMRMVSAQADVNVAQAYHYFGSKDALLTEAMRALAREWYEETAPSIGVTVHPSPVPLRGYPRYWRALIHAILDGDEWLAEVELREGISVARSVVASITQDAGHSLDAEDLMTLAAVFGMSLGWVAFERHMLKVVGLPQDDATVRAARERVEGMAREWVLRIGSSGYDH